MGCVQALEVPLHADVPGVELLLLDELGQQRVEQGRAAQPVGAHGQVEGEPLAGLQRGQRVVALVACRGEPNPRASDWSSARPEVSSRFAPRSRCMSSRSAAGTAPPAQVGAHRRPGCFGSFTRTSFGSAMKPGGR